MLFLKVIAFLFVAFSFVVAQLPQNPAILNQRIVRKMVSELETPELEENSQHLDAIRKAISNGKISPEVYSLEDSLKCAGSMAKLLADLIAGKGYAWKLIDSWGKFESGIANLNLMWEGRYFECEGIVEDTGMFKGKACLANIKDIPPYMGVCFPDTCDSESIATILGGVASVINITNGINVECPPDPHKWDALAIVATVITSILLLLVAIGTSYTMHRNSMRRVLVAVDGEIGIPERKLSFFEKSIAAFSIVTNTKSIMNTEKRKGNIHCLHGIRFISFTWVVLGHMISSGIFQLDNFLEMYNYSISHFSFMAILSATYSVDTFFFLSGLLVSFLGLRQMKKLKGKINVPLMYLARYLRLTPVYAYCILFTVSIMLVVGDGPFYDSVFQSQRYFCQQYWWTNLLYINNVYPVAMGDECFGWGWYLANDMQFYLLSPIFLILLYRKPKAGIAALIIGTLCSMSITGSLSWYYGIGTYPELVAGAEYDHKGDATANPANILASDTYAKPWCRVGVYFIGMLTGYILYATNGKVKMNKITVAVGWFLAAGLEMMLVYGLYRHIKNDTSSSLGYATFYNAVSRPMWGVGLGWVVIACVSGYGGIVDRFLSWRVFIPLGKLTYSAYLIHLILIQVLIYSSEVNFHFSPFLFGTLTVGMVAMSCACAYVLVILVEYPFMGILNAAIKKPAAKPTPQNSQLQNGQVEAGQNQNGQIQNGYIDKHHIAGHTAKDNIGFELEAKSAPTKF